MRNIKNGKFGWYEKGAMEKIETLPRRQQASCKLIYIAICSASSKQNNNALVKCYKFEIARFASVDEKTVQRYLPILEYLDIIKVSPQDRKSDGRFQKVGITLKQANLSDGHLQESYKKVSGKFVDTESDVLKESKEIKKVKKRESFKKPEIEELKKFIKENNYNVDPVIFLNHYESVGWRVGKNKMKDWKASVRGWHSRNKKESGFKANRGKQLN